MYQLVAMTDGGVVRAPLEPGRLCIGRGAQNDVVLVHGSSRILRFEPMAVVDATRSLGRQHAEILIDAGHITIRDLGSVNGTWVNGRRVTAVSLLHPGDLIRCGSREFTLQRAALREPAAKLEAAYSEQTLSFAPEVTTSDRLTLDEARSDLAASPALAHALLAAVSEAGQLLLSHQPLSEIFGRVLEAVERVVPARRILLLSAETPDREPEIWAARSRTPVQERLILSRSLLAAVLEERQSLLLNDAPHDPRFGKSESIVRQKLHSAMAAPLFDNQKVIGLLYADNDDIRCAYDLHQLRAFTLLANLIAIKITNAHLLESEREAERARERMEHELAAAAVVQRSMLPAQLPEVPGYQVAARQIACEQVAGDLYDVARHPDGRVGIVLGDVSGKGLSAALLMANVIAGLRIMCPDCPPLDKLADRLHREFLQSSDETHFVTLFLGILDPRTHRLEYVNAGHNPPLLVSPSGAVRTLGTTGMPLGLLPGATYQIGTADLEPGALLCIFSDGIPEALVADEFYGDERCLQSLLRRRDASLDALAEGLLEDVREFLGDQRPGDDITLLLLRREE